MKLKLFIFTACLVVVGAGVANLVPAIAGNTIEISGQGDAGEEQTVTVEPVGPVTKESNTTIEINEPEPTQAPEVTQAPQGESNEVKPTINPCAQ